MSAVNKGGRPPVGPRIAVRLPEEDLAMIDAVATQRGVSRADMMRQVIAAWAHYEWATQMRAQGNIVVHSKTVTMEEMEAKYGTP